MKLRPLQDRIIVKRVDQEKTTASGIVIPDNAAEKPDQGEVIAVGNGKVLEDGKVLPLDVKSATSFFSENIRARPSRLKAKNCSSCMNPMSWQLSRTDQHAKASKGFPQAYKHLI